ncbi:hypothetical protein Cs7R123_04160 [Catellatospora sp. TT07R-123]|uniref:hypothetical protein n=1 Tax=Catellatospora sp. TT07R-123 TaxID=2733863 RepID=UPI001B0EB036|nr:hypothetical protein [Catellatospora sp. TT07R-123]GHJ43074.1 hypothetical protein Cs7R123_04160 [Catellatospora sp. TT07R-123]
MVATFTNVREISSVDELTEIQREQVRLSGIAYDGDDLPAEVRLGDDTAEEHLFELTVWDVELDGVVAYAAWFYNVDSGSMFRADGTEIVAEVIQFGLECKDPELELRLGAGMVRAGLLPRGDSGYERYEQEALRADP